ncbi:MAG: gyrase subunit A protein [candidate division TM6 bacterium GW2011_GWF2_37_49]|nr:MAG: gyrase subunit A protein [candidate division TM6 bacterium GW2011_GWF2_37_49]
MAINDNQRDEKISESMNKLSIERELKTSFLDYAMSVIVSRALPDVRDGLKPVHRRILYAMHKLGYYHEKPYRKSATVVGEVIGHYHPHGDSAIYQSMVGLVQTFSKRYPLLDGQGNWGSVDGDAAAAMRYTEVRMAKIARELLFDIEKDTVGFVPNFDESLLEPTILPSRIPNLLVNGSTGIAVGMATSIPPHNLTEVVDACIEILKNPDLSEERLFQIIPGPDLPTGGLICGRAGIVKGYRTGYGQFIMRGVVDIEENKKHTAIIITELPYQVNKSDLITKIADLVKDKVIEGITNIRDESDRQGIRVVIELKRSEVPQVILNQLYTHTSLQTSMSIIMLSLHNNKPMFLTLREMIDFFIAHRKEIITKRCEFDLDKNQARAHILDGLIIALSNIDQAISIIKASQTADEACLALHDKFNLSDKQAKAILEMRLQRLTGLEREKINLELADIKKVITRLEEILASQTELVKEIVKELEQVKASYGDARKTKIEGAIDQMSDADLIPDEDVVVTLTRRGYIKRVQLATYSLQHRGGKGKQGSADLEELEDVIQDAFVTKNHDELLFFTNLGRVYSLSVFQVPEAGRTAKGRAIVNLLQMPEGEHIVKLMCARELENKFLVMITKHGTIKKTKADEFASIRKTGIRALTLDEGDELAFCSLSSGSDSIIIATSHGSGIRFDENEVRSMGRQAAGVRGIKLKKGDFVVGLEVISDAGDILFATSNGYGKRVKIVDFRVAHRGGQGVRTIPTDRRNGDVIGLVQVSDDSELLLIDTNGKIIRLSPQEIRTMGRQAAGVRLVRLDVNQTLSAVKAFVVKDDANQVADSEASNIEQVDSADDKQEN